MLYRSQVETIVDDVLREHLGGHGFAKADIGYEEDFDGEEIIRVTAHLDTPFEDVRVMMEAADAIRVRLLDEDDTRYVFLSQNYPGAGDRHGDADQLAGSVVS